MAKDTEKLIRQLSLISYLMAERRPVTALEIRRDVEGYSGMNEDAFARRFYADRAELSDLGIQLTIDKPVDGVAEQENYSLRPENFHLPAIAFTDPELASLQTALSLLDGEFAYAEPLRLALQQLTWGRPSPLGAPEQTSVALGITASAGGHDLSQRLAKIETAIFRNKTITFEYHTMERDEVGARKVDPYHLLYQGGQFYLLGHSHERGALRVFRLSRIKGKVAYATKAEHDFRRPADFDPRPYAARADWQFGDPQGTAEIWVSERIAWLVERHFGRFGEIRREEGSEEVVFVTDYASPRMLVSWVLRLGEHARILSPAAAADELDERAARLEQLHAEPLELAGPSRRKSAAETPVNGARRLGAARDRDPPGALRPARHAGVDPDRGGPAQRAPAGRRAVRAPADLRPGAARGRQRAERRQLRRRLVRALRRGRRGHRRDRGRPGALLRQLRAAGAAAARRGQGARRGDRPDRRPPAGRLAELGALEDRRSARRRPDGAGAAGRARRGRRLRRSRASCRRRSSAGGCCASTTTSPTRTSTPSARSSPTTWSTGARAGTSPPTTRPRTTCATSASTASARPRSSSEKYAPRPEVKPSADLEGWTRTGEVEASRIARVWISPERARWAREERTVAQELSDGSVIVELPFAGADFLVREVLKEAGDAAVLEPEVAREAVLEAVQRLRSETKAAH